MLRLLFGLLAFGWWIGVAFSSAADTLVLNDPTGPPLTTSENTGFLDVVVGETFRRNNHQLVLVRLPAERGLINANNGIEDGDLSRIAGLERAYPNLRRIPEKLFDMQFVGFAKDSNVRIDGWESLKPYKIGLIKGWKIFENNIPKGTDFVVAKSADQLFTMLEKNRIEVALYSKLLGMGILSQRRMADVFRPSPSLAVKEMFVYLNKRHAHLIPALAETLSQLKADGFYQDACQKTVGPLACGK